MLRQKVLFTTYGTQGFSVFSYMSQSILNILRPPELKSVPWKDNVWLTDHIISHKFLYEGKNGLWTSVWPQPEVCRGLDCIFLLVYFFITNIAATYRIECLCSLGWAGIANKSVKTGPGHSLTNILKISCINVYKVNFPLGLITASSSKVIRKYQVL